MLRKLAAAAIAVSLLAAPALAQGNLNTTTTIGQLAVKAPAKAEVKTPAKAEVKTEAKMQKSELTVGTPKKHVAMHRYHRRHFAHVKHVKHVAFAKHVKQIKQVKQQAKAKIAG
jgi:hypothetical protein